MNLFSVPMVLPFPALIIDKNKRPSPQKMTPNCIQFCLQSSLLTICLGEGVYNLSDSFPVSATSQALDNWEASECELGKEEREPGKMAT